MPLLEVCWFQLRSNIQQLWWSSGGHRHTPSFLPESKPCLWGTQRCVCVCSVMDWWRVRGVCLPLAHLLVQKAACVCDKTKKKKKEFPLLGLISVVYLVDVRHILCMTWINSFVGFWSILPHKVYSEVGSATRRTSECVTFQCVEEPAQELTTIIQEI